MYAWSIHSLSCRLQYFDIQVYRFITQTLEMWKKPAEKKWRGLEVFLVIEHCIKRYAKFTVKLCRKQCWLLISLCQPFNTIRNHTVHVLTIHTIKFPTQFLIQDKDLCLWWRILAPNPFIAICNSQTFLNLPHVLKQKMKSRILYMYTTILHFLKARTMMDNIILSHSYILVFLPKTLILICITLSLITEIISLSTSLHSVVREL